MHYTEGLLELARNPDLNRLTDFFLSTNDDCIDQFAEFSEDIPMLPAFIINMAYKESDPVIVDKNKIDLDLIDVMVDIGSKPKFITYEERHKSIVLSNNTTCLFLFTEDVN